MSSLPGPPADHREDHWQHSFYKSPDGYGRQSGGFGIIDDDAVREAAIQEIIRRYFRYGCEYAIDLQIKRRPREWSSCFEDLDAKPEDRIVVKPAGKRHWRPRRTERGTRVFFAARPSNWPVMPSLREKTHRSCTPPQRSF